MDEIIDRFLVKTKITSNDCWEWTACSDRDGYGVFQEDGRAKRAHRVSYEFFVDRIPRGMNVLHRCDNPRCVNPKHLFLGTTLDNNRDAIRKNRHSHGEDVPNSKLTLRLVNDMRLERLGGRRLVDLSQRYGISICCVGLICKGQSWRHLSLPLGPILRRKGSNAARIS